MEQNRRHRAGRFTVELLPRRGYDASYRADSDVIGFAFDGQSGVHAFATDRRRDFFARPNGLAYVPSGCDVYSRSDEGGEYLRITAAPGAALRLGDRPFSDAIDADAIRAARGLRSFMLGAAVDPLTAEALAERLARCAGRQAGLDAPPRAARWMTARRLKQIDAAIEAGLDHAGQGDAGQGDVGLGEGVSVSALAAGIGLSAGFFARAFKAALGQSPHDYVIDRRVARARELMTRGGIRLDTVALAAGFTSHAHMTATFRSRFGVTPSQLRQGLKQS